MKKHSAIIWLIAFIGGLCGIHYSNLHLVEARKDYNITQANPMINAPPLVVFTTVALGGFRGIIADMLWMRSARLQHEGKFFELVQLADWITKLEPRFSDVWAYHAWNLSYNISIMFPDYGDRWRWVRHGFTMLRDEGLLYNPGEPRLLYELGWIFQHKIGGLSDDAHLYYKHAWATEMESMLVDGAPPYQRLFNAPKTREELFAQRNMNQFLSELQKTGLDPFNFRSVQIPEDHAAWPVIHQHTQAAESWSAFLLYRKYTQEYKLDPAKMKEIERQCGPLDWRLPQAHAIYWATLSKNTGGEADAIAANRMIYQSMADAVRRGKIAPATNENPFAPVPYPELLPYAVQCYENAISHPGERGIAIGAYRNFLTEAAILMFLYERKIDAEYALAKLKDITPELAQDISLTDFVVAAFTRFFSGTPGNAPANAVEDALYQSLYWQRMGDTALANGYENFARLLFDSHQSDFGANSPLPSFESLRDQAKARTLRNAGDSHN